MGLNVWQGCRKKKTSFSIGQSESVANTMMLTAPCMDARSNQMSSWIETAPSRLPTKKRNYPERRHQQALVKWLRLRQVKFHSIPNEGKRSRALGAVMRSTGLTEGVSDLFIREMRGGYGGFYIELKAPGRIPTQAQYDFLHDAKREGYMAEWFDDWDKARLSIESYLALPKSR